MGNLDSGVKNCHFAACAVELEPETLVFMDEIKRLFDVFILLLRLFVADSHFVAKAEFAPHDFDPAAARDFKGLFCCGAAMVFVKLFRLRVHDIGAVIQIFRVKFRKSVCALHLRRPPIVFCI